MGLNKTHAQRKGNTMFQLRRILLSGLVALLMVGMVTAGIHRISRRRRRNRTELFRHIWKSRMCGYKRLGMCPS